MYYTFDNSVSLSDDSDSELAEGSSLPTREEGLDPPARPLGPVLPRPLPPPAPAARRLLPPPDGVNRPLNRQEHNYINRYSKICDSI